MEEEVKEHYFSRKRPPGKLGDKIVQALKEAGRDLNRLEIKDLSVIDQLHTGGFQATLDLINRVHLEPGSVILDAGCGIGGSSRLLADRFKFRMVGVDIVDEFILTADCLTKLIADNRGISDLIEFRQGSILETPLPDGSNDAVLSQHILMNIKEKQLLFREFNRVLKPGGVLLLHEVVKTGNGNIDFPVPWADNHNISYLSTWDVLLKGCKKAGFELVHFLDKTEHAEKWWIKVRQITEKFSNNPRPLGPHLIFGDNGNLFGKTMTFNIQTGQLGVIEAILKKI